MAITRSRTVAASGMLAVAAVLASALIASPAALGHASLLDSTPARNAVLDRAPEEVVLPFDEPVSTVPGSVRVFDSEVRRVDSGDVAKPTSESVSVSLSTDLPHGTYVVA